MMFKAPARIDLAGGTLDVPPLCFLFPSVRTLNLAISLSVTLRLDGGLEPGLHTADAPLRRWQEEPLFDLALRHFELSPQLALKVESNIPRASGLGGSSVLLAALCAALAFHKHGVVPSERELLGTVTVLEHRLLGKPAGTQDAAAAIYGGLSRLSFSTGQLERQALPLPTFLKGTLWLAYLPVEHHSGLNNWNIIKAACEGHRATLDVLAQLNENSVMMDNSLVRSDEALFRHCLEREALLRGRLAPDWIPIPMRRLMDDLGDSATAKICGAGGGGCMFLFGHPDPLQLAAMVRRQGMSLVPVSASPLGLEACLP